MIDMTPEDRAIKALLAGLKDAIFIPNADEEASWERYRLVFEGPEAEKGLDGRPKMEANRAPNKKSGPVMAHRILALLREAGLRVEYDD